MQGKASMAAVAAAAMLTWSAARAEDVVKVAIGGRGALESSPAELGQAAGFFARHGVRVEPTYTAGSGESLQGVIAGSFDVGIGVGTGSVMGAFAKGAPVRAIGAAITGANDLFWYVRSDSLIRTIPDLSGRTVAYSTAGSSTQAVVLGLREHYTVDLKPTATGSPQATFTQVMSGQIDVGWSSGATFLEAVEDGRTRIVARGGDVPSMRNQTPRLIIANASALSTRRDVLDRFMQGYRETIAWLYTSPDGIKAFAAWAGLPETIAVRARDEIYAGQAIDCDRVIGLDLAMADALRLKFLAAPLSPAQLSELFQVPPKK